MSKPLVIYHGNCADGFTAAWCFHKKYGDTYEYFAGTYQTPPPDVTGRDVYLVDFSYKRPVVEKMLSVANSVTLIDHHKSAIEDLDGLKDHYDNYYLYISLVKSGARLAWEWCFGSFPAPYVLKHVEARDLWKFLPATREVTAVVFSYEYTFENWDALMSVAEDRAGISFNSLDDGYSIGDMISEGQAVERKHHKDVAELNKALTFRMNIGGHNVPVVNVPYTYGSDACNKLCEGEPFAAYFYFKPTGVEFGLRSSEKGLDVSAIAVLYSGGGHRNASGFRVSFEKFNEMFTATGDGGLPIPMMNVGQ